MQSGGKRQGAGRRKGVPNKSTQEIKEVVESVLPRVERFKLLAKMAKKGNYKALELLCYYGDGKPKESIEMNHSGAVSVIKDNR